MTIDLFSPAHYWLSVPLAILLAFMASLLLLNSALSRRIPFKTAFNCKLFNFLFETEKPTEPPAKT